MGEPASDVLLARAYLSRVAEPASFAVWRLVGELGPVDAASAIQAGSVAADVAGATQARRLVVDAEADLAAAERHGIRLVVPESDEWPHFAFGALERTAAGLVARSRNPTADECGRGLPIPPLALWVRGEADLAGVGVRSAAIVGSRSATAYGEQVAAGFAHGLARRGVTVVSGGAYGIDAAAHRASLAGDGSTIIVSAGGVDRPYPAGNAWLYERAVEAGLVVSESPPGCAPQRHRFLSRNRLIAALSTGTVVVEAAARSGALNTATHCVVLGRPLMVVPGPVTSGRSAGCHALLKRHEDRALIVERVDDVLAVVGSAGEGIDLASSRSALDPDDLRLLLDRLDPLARRVFDGLPATRPVLEDQLAVRAGVSPLEVIRALPALRLAGLLESSDGGHRISAALRRRRVAT